MPSFRLAVLAALSLSLISGCGKDASEAALPAVSDNALLGFAPAGTPYLAGDLEPLPDAVIDAMLHRAQPVLTALQAELDEAQTVLQDAPPGSDRGGRVLLAVLQELDGKLSRNGLQSLGLDFQADKVLYGMGAFPVLRLGLSDTGVFRATVQRVIDQAGLVETIKEFQGHSYWRLTHTRGVDEPSEVPIGLYLAIVDDHLAASLFPPAAEADFLPHLLGLARSGGPAAGARLQAAAKRFGYSPYSVASVDFRSLADEFMNPASITTRALAGAGLDLPSQLSEVCQGEYRAMIAHTPALFIGTTEVSESELGTRYVLETEPSLAGRLTSLVAQLPRAGALSSRLLELSFALKFGASRDFLRQNAQSISEAPYQCENLAVINQKAADAYARLSQPMLPLINNFQGLRASISTVHPGALLPNRAEGLLAVHVAQPEMFVGMAQMFVPDLSALQLVPNGPPVQLPASLVPVADLIVFAALSDAAIGVSVGAGEEGGLTAFLNSQADADGTFISVDYDTAALLDLTAAAQGGGPTNTAGSKHQAHRLAVTLARAIRRAQRSMAGRTWFAARFTGDGLVIDSRMTYTSPAQGRSD